MSLDQKLAGMPTWMGALLGLALMAGAAALQWLLLPHPQTVALYVVAAVLAGLASGAAAGALISLIGAALFTMVLMKPEGGPLAYPNILNASGSFAAMLAAALAAGGLRRALQAQRLYSRTDQLTGTDNMASFMERAQAEMKRARRSRLPISVAYIDIDNLKEINDLLGFIHGDRLLVAFAGDLKNHTRSSDIVARLGGDEFVILFPETGVDQARGAAVKIHKSFQEVAERENCHASLTIGLVTVFNPDLELEAVLKQASDMLLQAKGDGGNAVRDGVLG